MREQIAEGFRRISMISAFCVATASLLLVGTIIQPLAPGGTWWRFAVWAAVVLPFAWTVGALIANTCAWIIGGFPPQERNYHVDPYEMEGAPLASWLLKWFTELFPLALYFAWVLAWIVADFAGGVVDPSAQGWRWAVRVISIIAVTGGTIAAYFVVQTVVLLLVGRR